MSVLNLLRPHIKNLVPYSSARDEYKGSEGIFLDANENPFGSVTSDPYNRYPDPYQHQVKEKLAQIKGVHPDQIFLGNGSDEAIELLYRAFCRPGVDNVILLPPTYGMYEVSANINDVEVIKVPLTAQYQIDSEAVLKAANANTKLLFICAPNNPTANLPQQEAVLTLLREFKGVVIVDEAYIDFCPEATFVSRLKEFPHLVVMQTFSKAWGLAALRLGMAFASPELIAVLNKIKPPYNISAPTQQLALQALGNEVQKNEMVAQILEQRTSLVQDLSALDTVEHVYPSDANFVLVRVKDAAALFHYLIEHKIIVRDRSRVTRCEGCLRITVGTASENEVLVDAIRQYQLAAAL
jgi:histidinol-phosphate aminotransferase